MSQTITCPKCGTEYLPSEIFIPEYFFGNPGHISRDKQGKIKNITGTDMDTNETFTCDKCNETLTIKTNINFKVSIENYIDFDTDFEHKI